MAKRYNVQAIKEVEYEATGGVILTEVSEHEEVNTGSRESAKKEARKLYDTGKYTSITIQYAHHDSPCYLNPRGGLDIDNENWIPHFEASEQYETVNK